ncbi:MAG TPA: tripartite tricarboxylate transporter substrate-binding protein [Candidatus Binatia bacterium]|nr:tripartite tricarboxylate transporter substrate-binding protein [Candidatus Binatia bacterium]
MVRKFFSVCLGVLSVLGLASPGYSSTHDFYKGKTIRFITAFSPGGAFDVYTRAIARHYGKHVPGNPSTIVENMTGAGGIIQANYMFQRTRPDGLTIGNNIGGLILQQIMGAKGIEFDGRKFEYLGVPSADDSVCALTKASGVTSMESWFAAKEPVKLGGVGPGGTLSDVARTIKSALGLPIRVIDGYKGVADVRLAADSGELAGYCGGWESVKLQWRKALEAGQVSLVLQVTTKKNPELPHVPLAIDFAKGAEARQLLKYAVHDVAIMQRLFFLPPGTPKERVRLLRKSFLDTLKDPEFLAEATKTSLTINPVTGEEIEEIVAGLFKLDAAMVANLKSVLVP